MQGEGVITIGNYTFDSRYCIGQGSFGKVYKGTTSQYIRSTYPNSTISGDKIIRSIICKRDRDKQINIDIKTFDSSKHSKILSSLES